MISELTPRGYENMFFALFGITNRAVSHSATDQQIRLIFVSQSSIIGPNVIQAIINDTNNNWMGFPFLFAICTGALIVICFVNVEQGRADARRFLEDRKLARIQAESGLTRTDIFAKVQVDAVTADEGMER